MSLKAEKKKLLDVFRNGELNASLWTQGYYARDKNQVVVDRYSPEAVSWCLEGAIGVSGLINSDLHDRIQDRLDNKFISTWNDDPKRTFKDVIALIKSIGDEDVPQN